MLVPDTIQKAEDVGKLRARLQLVHHAACARPVALQVHCSGPIFSLSVDAVFLSPMAAHAHRGNIIPAMARSLVIQPLR